MRHMDREGDTHVSRLFIEVTPGIRRALELLAEASITLLDEIDAPVDELEDEGNDEPCLGWANDGRGVLMRFSSADDREVDDDFELECEDEGAQCDDEGFECDLEPNLGGLEGDDADEDLVAAETSGGFPARVARNGVGLAKAKARFDPRLASRPDNGKDWWRANNPIPPFPHDPPGRAPLDVEDEIYRLNKALRQRTAKRERRRSKIR